MTQGATRRSDDPTFQRFAAHVLPYVTAYWQDVTDPNGQLTFEHDHYLKMWSLTNPQLPYDCILFDEAQDANPCIAHVVEFHQGQAIMVGDSAQAIYGWRGAVNAMESFNADWRLPLTKSFRFGDVIAEQANRWLTQVGTPLRITGFEKITSKVKSLSQPHAVLCRTNAGCLETALRYQEEGKRVAIQGGTKDIERFAWAANDLMSGQGTDHPELGVYNDWTEVQEAVKDGEASDIGMLVRLIDKYSTSLIIKVCKQSEYIKADDQAAFIADGGIMISTAHKAKGLEWDHVQIHGDFKPKTNEETGEISLSVTEAMLIYVAVTRAKLTLDSDALSWLNEIEGTITDKINTDNGEAA
jgi:superfamily I DNA/RNA helicase